MPEDRFDLDKYLKMLKSPKADTRYDACEELRVATKSSPEIILALEEATQDENDGVAERARQALAAGVHKEMASKIMAIKMGINLPNLSTKELDYTSDASIKQSSSDSSLTLLWIIVIIIACVFLGFFLWMSISSGQ